MMKRINVVFLGVVFFVVLANLAAGNTPQLLSFQGRIVDANGQPLADGSYSMTFGIWDAVTGGTQQWSETQASVSVTNGLFSVLLGSVTSLSSLTFDQSYWLEITVGASTYTPRQQLSASAYAFNVPDLRITTAKIKDSAVTDAKILDMSWTKLKSYPTACSSGTFVTAVGDTLTCSSVTSGGGWIDNGTWLGLTTSTDSVTIGGTAAPSYKLEVVGTLGVTGNTTIGDAGTDTLTLYPNTTTLTGNTNKILDVGPGVSNTTLTITNSDVTGVANLTVEGTVTAPTFSGTATNAKACSGDATCETNAISATGNISATGALSGATLNTGFGDNELYVMDQNVQTTDSVTFQNLVVNGNTQVGNSGIDLFTVYPTILDWNNVDEDKTIYVGSGITDRTLTLTNPDATGKANLVVEGSVTAASFSGTVNNALACDGDATCETNAISASGSITATGALSGTSLDTGLGANELYAMNQNVRTTDNVTFANLTSTGNTQIGNAAADTLTVYPGTFTWSGDANKTISIANSINNRTVTLTNPGTGVANLSVEGDVTVTGGDIFLPDANTDLKEGAGNSFRVQTNSGYVDIGPQNTSWAHFNTDRAAFYFGKPVVPAGNTYPYSNNTYTLGTAANRWSTIYGVNGNFSGTITGTLSGTATNANSCNADATCETQAISATGNISTSGDLTVSGTDVDLIRGDTSLIHSVGRISFDWTAGTYDTPDNHGITSKNESGVFSDSLRINSYNDLIVTLDSNNNNATSNFKVQHHSTTNGGDLFTVQSPSGNTTVAGTLTVTSTLAANNGITVDGSTVIDNGAGWHRSYGSTGWYNGTYSGGIYMTDSTYVKTYNSKAFRADGGFYKGTDPIIKVVSYVAGTTTCPTGFKVVACYSNTDTNNQTTSTWGNSTEGATTGNVFSPSDCSAPNGRMICVYAP